MCHFFSFFFAVAIVFLYFLCISIYLLLFCRQVWDLKRNNSRVTMRGHGGPVNCLSFLDRDSCVAAGDDGGRILLHRLDVAPDEVKRERDTKKQQFFVCLPVSCRN